MRFDTGFCVLVLASAGLSAQPSFAPSPLPPAPFEVHTAGAPHSFLGVAVAEITAEWARDLKLKDEHGVEITRIEDNTAAAKAGLKVGDVVLEYNGQRVEGTEQFIRLVRETPPGRRVNLLISRNGAAQTVGVALGSRAASNVLMGRSGDWPGMPEVVMPDMPRVFTAWNSSMLGVEAEGLGNQLAEYFGVREGVLVRSVVEGSAAAKAGIKAGDVILRVDQANVTNPGDLGGAVRAARSKKSFPVQLMRDHHEMTLTVTMDDDRSDQVLPRIRQGAVKM